MDRSLVVPPGIPGTGRGRGRTVRRAAAAAAVLTAAAGLSLAGTGAAHAATLTVTNCDSSGTGSLAAAVADAGAGDTISLEGLSCDLITLTSTLDITTAGSLAITGPGAAHLAVSGGGSVEVFYIGSAASVTIYGLTIENGQGGAGSGGSAFPLPGQTGDGGSGGPGGIDNAGELTLSNVGLTGNTGGTGGAGGNAPVEGSGGVGGSGGTGGIFSTGSLTLDTVSISGNTGGVGGDSGFSAVDVNGCTAYAGVNGGTGGAGGLQYTGSLTVGGAGALVTGNTGGAGGKGGQGSAAYYGAQGFGYGTCSDGNKPGGAGGTGGTGGILVGNDSSLSGVPANAANTGGAAGASGLDGDGTTVDGPAGSPGADDLQPGAQQLSWSPTPPAGQNIGTSFSVAATSTSGLAPQISATDGCSASGSSGTVAITVNGPVGACTVTADQAGDTATDQPEDAYYLPATLSASVNMLDPGPVITPQITGTVGNGGWYTSDVTLTWTVTNPYSLISTESAGCDTTSITTDQASTAYTCSAASADGTTTSVTVNIARDATPPVLSPSGLTGGQVFAAGQPGPTVTAGAQDAMSGVASQGCTTVSTASAGLRTVSCQATDNAGNTATTSITYYVTDAFGGFIAPLPRSAQQAGSTLPVKFTLTNWAGTSQVKTGTVRVTTAPAGAPAGTATTSAACAYSTSAAAWQCNLKMSSKAGTYQIEVFEQVGGTWQLVANASKPSSSNPTSITVK